MYTRILLAAGLVPLPWFLFWSTIAGVLTPGYNALSQHASELTLQPGVSRTLLNLAAMGSGGAFLVFAIGLWLASGRRFAVGASCWLLFGVAMISNGLWPMGNPLHGMYAIGVFNLIAPALSLLELPRLRDNKLAFGVTALVSVCGVIYLWLNLAGADPQNLRGFTQRIFSSINSLWPATMALLLLRHGRV
jgi:hypothetical membrane protein